MLSLSYLLCLMNILSSLVISTPSKHQKPLITTSPSSHPPIPGDSTFEYCSESDPENDIFTIERIAWVPNPPKISREQQLFVYGIFSERIPSSATGTGKIHIPEWHNPYDPASNYTITENFCQWPNFVYQNDNERGTHKVCNGAVGGNSSAPEAGPAVLVGEDILFWPLPEGEYRFKLDMLMPENEGGARERIFCLKGTVDLDY